jgi:hypothetical protein
MRVIELTAPSLDALRFTTLPDPEPDRQDRRDDLNMNSSLK